MRWRHLFSRKKPGNGLDARPATEVFLAKPANTNAALRAAVRVLQQKTEASGVAAAMAEGHQLVCRARAGEIAPAIGVALSADTGITAACVRSAKLLQCHDALTDDRVDAAVCCALGIRSILVTPILVDGVVVGILEALSTRSHAFQLVHMKWLEALADWVRDFCYGHYGQRLDVSEGHIGPELTRLTDNLEDKSSQFELRAEQPDIGNAPRQQDPGLASFRVAVQQMPITSSWEDICETLVQRLET